MTDAGKDLYEHLEILHAFCADTNTEASLDFVVNELAKAAATAAHYDGDRAYAVNMAVRSFQWHYRKPYTPEPGFRGPAFDEPI